MRLSRFIAWFIILVLILVSILTSYAISSLYHAGLDDSSQFYLWKDTQQAQRHYQETGRLPNNDSFREFYLDISQLPAPYAARVKAKSLEVNQLLLVELPTESVYIMPFILSQTQQPAFVLHHFTEIEDEGYTESKFSSILVWFLVLGIPSALLLAYALFRAIATPVGQLSQWSQTLAQADDPQPIKGLRFIELKNLADLFYEAYSSVKESNRREKQFLQTLSHELRTPLAVTQTTLDVLERKETDIKWQAQLKRMRRANQTMQDLTHTLLWLWRDSSTMNFPLNQPVDVEQLIEQSWQDLQLASSEHHLLDKQISPQLHWTVPYTLLQIIINNMLKNAQQYGAGDSIVIYANAQSLCVENKKSSQESQGFGLGLSLVRHIVERMQWQFVLKEDQQQFSVTIIF